MQKQLPFEVQEGRFDYVFLVQPSVVMELGGLSSHVGPFLLNSLVNSMQLGQI